MVTRVAYLGNNIPVGRVSHGLMMMCFPVGGKSDADCFDSIKAGVDALPNGAKAFLNAGEFYSSTGGTENLELLARFYAKYPDYAERTFISVKGGIVHGKRMPDCSMDNLRRSIETITKALGPLKKLDLYEPARIDPNVPVEDMMRSLVVLLKEGHFTHIGLSECSANTLRRAHAVHPITAVEIEVSLWSYEQETKDVIKTAAELGVAVAAYSPVGRGFLIGQIKSRADLAEGDIRAPLSRLSEENIEHNLGIVQEILAIAKKKGVTPAQLCIAWVAALGPHVIPLPGSSKAARTLENLQGGDVELTAEEMADLTAIAERADFKGGRYYGGAEMKYLWG